MLQDNWKDSKEEYNHAKRVLKEYEKQKKSTRCPNGTRRNKKTGKCDHAKRELKKYEKQKKSTRCPNGTRRNKKTGKCEK